METIKCPHCGKILMHDEMLCWYCENDLTEFREKEHKHSKKEHD